MNFDGAAKRKPGQIRLCGNAEHMGGTGSESSNDGEFMGIHTNNVAEYAAMTLGLWSMD